METTPEELQQENARLRCELNHVRKRLLMCADALRRSGPSESVRSFLDTLEEPSRPAPRSSSRMPVAENVLGAAAALAALEGGGA